MARELIILPRFKRDYRKARKHPEFDVETLEDVFDILISSEKLPSALRGGAVRARQKCERLAMPNRVGQSRPVAHCRK